MVEIEQYLQNPSLDYLEKLEGKGLISKNLSESLLKDWTSRSAKKSSSQLEKILLHYEACLGIVAITLYDLAKDKIMLESGSQANLLQKVLNKARKNGLSIHDKIDDEFSFLYKKQKFCFNGTTLERRFYLSVLTPPGIRIRSLIGYLGNVLEQLVIPHHQSNHNGYLPLFYYLTRDIPKQVNPYLVQNKPVTFSLFTFDFSPEYIEILGPNLSRRILKEISETTSKNLKQRDTLVAINLQNYIIISENCEKEHLQDRLSALLIEIKGLVISFDLRMITIRKEIKKFSDVWRHLKKSEKKN
jgi:hypothetical protein